MSFVCSELESLQTMNKDQEKCGHSLGEKFLRHIVVKFVKSGMRMAEGLKIFLIHVPIAFLGFLCPAILKISLN